jgi:hypothetical protein
MEAALEGLSAAISMSIFLHEIDYYVVKCWSMTVDGFLIDDDIYWTI